MAFDRAWLRSQIPFYIKDNSLSVHLDTFIDLGAKRLSNILQCRELEGELVRSAGDSDSFIAMPSNVRRLLGVQYQNNAGQYVNLRSVGRHAAAPFKGVGQPQVYFIQDSNIYPAPFNDGNYLVQTMEEAVVPETGESAALTMYPYVFLYAALAEAYDWKEDEERRLHCEGKWMADAEQITRIYLSDRMGETPAVRAI